MSLLKDDSGNYVDAAENATEGVFPTIDQIKARFAGQDFFYTGNNFWATAKPFDKENKVNQYAYVLKPGWDAQVFAERSHSARASNCLIG